MSCLPIQSNDDFGYGDSMGDFDVKVKNLEFVWGNSKSCFFLETWLPNLEFLNVLSFLIRNGCLYGIDFQNGGFQNEGKFPIL